MTVYHIPPHLLYLNTKTAILPCTAFSNNVNRQSKEIKLCFKVVSWQLRQQPLSSVLLQDSTFFGDHDCLLCYHFPPPFSAEVIQF